MPGDTETAMCLSDLSFFFLGTQLDHIFQFLFKWLVPLLGFAHETSQGRSFMFFPFWLDAFDLKHNDLEGQMLKMVGPQVRRDLALLITTWQRIAG